MHPYPPRPLGHRRTALALLVSAAGSLALADAGRDIEQTLVTATRTEQPLHEVMAPVTVITREDIERIQPLDVMELLEQAPGASLSRTGGYGAATSLMLRGNSSGHTLVMVDGVRINSATLGGASLSYINPALIERIEIVRGPRSSLYGSDAIGGVVNIITRRPQGEFQPRLQAGIGNHGIRQSEVFIGGGDERLSAGLTASHFYTTGIDHTTHKDLGRGDDDAFRETSLGLTLDHRPTDWLQAGLSYQHNRSKNEHDTSCLDFSYSPLTCSPYTRSRVETLNGQLVLTPLAGWDSTLRLGRATDEQEERANDIDIHQTSSGGEFKTRRTQYSWQNDFSMIEGQVLTLGYDFEREEVSSDTVYDRDKRLNRAWFGQLQSQWTPVLDTVVGYRKDDNGQFGNYETANAALGIQLPADFRLIASYSEGFKAPTFNDLYYENYGNPELVPETSKNHELELRGQHFGVHWSLNAFHNKVKRLIQYNPATFGPDQIDAARLRGAELSADTELAGWQLGVSATYLQPRDTRTGNDLQLRPRRFATLNADRQFGDLQLGLGLRVESSRYGDPANSYRLPGYGKANLRLGYAVNEEWQLKLKLDNLLDKKIKLASDSPLHYYRQPGLEAIVSVAYTPR